LKNPPAAKKPTVQAVQHVQTVQIVERFYSSEMVPIRCRSKTVEDLKAALEQFREIASDLGIQMVYRKMKVGGC